MPITYRLDRELQVIFETWTGDISAQELESYWKAYTADPEVMDVRRTIVDMRNGRPTFNGDDLARLIRSVVTPVLNGRDWKTAIVVKQPLQFGVSRQYGALAAHYSTDAIFEDTDSALRWLLSSQ